MPPPAWRSSTGHRAHRHHAPCACSNSARMWNQRTCSNSTATLQSWPDGDFRRGAEAALWAGRSWSARCCSASRALCLQFRAAVQPGTHDRGPRRFDPGSARERLNFTIDREEQHHDCEPPSGQSDSSTPATPPGRFSSSTEDRLELIANQNRDGSRVPMAPLKNRLTQRPHWTVIWRVQTGTGRPSQWMSASAMSSPRSSWTKCPPGSKLR